MYTKKNKGSVIISEVEVKFQGDIPSPRKGHCAFVYNKSMYIYGGQAEDKESTNWIHQLTFGKYEYNNTK